MFTNGSSKNRGSGTSLTLESEIRLVVEVSLCFKFTTTNNQKIYEAFIFGLMLASDIGDKEIKLQTNSQLAISQVKGGSKNLKSTTTKVRQPN